MKHKIKKLIKANCGFTLIESMVAVTILVVGVLSVFSFLTFNISQSVNMKNKIIALNLAQEGIEIVRNIRDNCWISNQPILWANCLTSGVYNVNYNSTILMDLPDELEFDGVNYFHSVNPNTPFLRIITISDNPDSDLTTPDIKAESKVSWQEKNIIIEERFYNWGGNN